MKQTLIFEKGEQEFAAPVSISETFIFTEENQVPDMFSHLNLEKGRYFWGYANIATPDTQGDKFTLDALTQISYGLTTDPYNKVFLFHDYKDISIGTIVGTMVDSLGLLILGKINEAHKRADEVYESIVNGNLGSFSMSGNFIKVIQEWDDATSQYINLVLEATAKEVTLTSIPVHPGASVMGTFRKSIDNQMGKRFLKSVQEGKEYLSEVVKRKVEKSETYKKDSDLCKNMTEDETQKKEAQETEASDNSEENKPAEEADTNTSEAPEAKEGSEKAEGKEEENTEETKEDEEFKKDESKSEEETEEKKTEESKEEADDSEESKDEGEKKEESVEDDATEETQEQKYEKAIAENAKLKKENADLLKEQSNFKKSLDENGVPARKSAKVVEKTPSANKSNSTPMLNWLKN